MPRVVHCKREPNATYIGRPSIFGNPFPLRSEQDRAKVIEEYRSYFFNRIEGDVKFYNAVLSLKGQDLGCWCAPRACHGDVILEWLETH